MAPTVKNVTFSLLLAIISLSAIAKDINPRTISLIRCTDGQLVRVGMACPDPAPTGVLFAEDFDSSPDWTTTKSDERCNYGGGTDCGLNNTPTNWDWYYLSQTEQWSPLTNPAGMWQGYINSSLPDASPGGTGKSFILYDELTGSNGAWNSEMQIYKELPQQYKELYLRFKIKFQPNYYWSHIENGLPYTVAMKIARFHTNLDTANNSVTAAFVDSPNVPMAIFDLKDYFNGNTDLGVRYSSSTRCYPATTSDEYYCPNFTEDVTELPPTYPTTWASFENQWQTMEMRVKMNSAAGVADGIIQMWVNGELIIDQSNVPFVAGSGPESTQRLQGFNLVSIGGNASNHPLGGETAVIENWHQYDEIEICTERCTGSSF